MPTLKTCFKCGTEKPRTEFYKHPEMADGLLGKCKQCTRIDVRLTREARAEYYKEYDRMRYRNDASRKASAIASFKAAAGKYPDRTKAAKLLRNAIKRGDVQPHPCWVCGERAEGHHPDYSRPLDVVWLCVTHHRQAHGLVRRIDDDIAA